DQVVGAVREGRVVEGAVGLGGGDGVPAGLHHQHLAHDQAGLVRCGEGPGTALHPLDVRVAAGEGHGRVGGHHDGAGVRGRAKDVRADSTGEVDDDVSRPERPGGDELVDDAGQCGVGDGEDQQFAGPGDGGG